MREKKEYFVIAFHTTAAAMMMENFCEVKGIKGRLIPVPREISAGCGLSWRATPEEFKLLNMYIKEYEKGNEIVYKLVSENCEIELETIVKLLL